MVFENVPARGASREVLSNKENIKSSIFFFEIDGKRFIVELSLALNHGDVVALLGELCDSIPTEGLEDESGNHDPPFDHIPNGKKLVGFYNPERKLFTGVIED